MQVLVTDDLHDKLKRLNALIGGPKKPPASQQPSRYRQMAEQLGAELITNHAGVYCLKRTLYPATYRHGQALLSRLDPDRPLALSAFTPDDRAGVVNLRRTMFFDTETTGLGGAGVVPFLCGCGSFTLEGFEVRQYILPDYSDEAALLEDLLEEFGENTTVVSYNGKAFDEPIVRDRMIINRVARQIPMGEHVDLLHATRRLFRRRLQDCTLGNIERRLFGFERTDDIPGYLIPTVYFEWLSEQKLDLMHDVIEHNCLDIITLAFLADHLATIFDSSGETLDRTDDIHSLARVYGRRKQNDEVNKLYQRIAGDSPENLPEDVRWYHSLALKRGGEWDGAVSLWLGLASSNSREGYRANVELAKYFEHRQPDLSRAIEYARRARRVCSYPSHLKALDHRLRRLEDRQNRP
jgi:hypothetical protein